MPSAPPRACARCGKAAQKGKPCSCRPAWEGSTHPGGDRRWRGLRKKYLSIHPICEAFDDHGIRCRRPADEVDHITPLAEWPEGRYVWDNLQALCGGPDGHHAQKTTQDALRGKKRTR